jgi:hypothetical protein
VISEVLTEELWMRDRIEDGDRREESPPRKKPVALAGTEAWLGGRLRRLVLSVEVDWWHSRCSPTSQPLARSSSTLLFDPSKRPNSHGCKTSWRPEDLRGRFEIRELCPFHGH